MATVTVRQGFKNTTRDRLQATYLREQPHQTSVFGTEFRLGECTMRGMTK